MQGRGQSGDELMADAKDLEAAGAFAVVLECVPTDLAERVTTSLSIPTIGIGAGPSTDAQVLVWQDLMGLTERPAKFVKKYFNLAEEMDRAVRSFAGEVAAGPSPRPSTATTDPSAPAPARRARRPPPHPAAAPPPAPERRTPGAVRSGQGRGIGVGTADDDGHPLPGAGT
nr:hypothetical protein GCM10020093_111030 [Planobispora longispora]